ncbi:MAG: hypothetical protein WCJ42_01585 [Actinomycetes bacterium]
MTVAAPSHRRSAGALGLRRRELVSAALGLGLLVSSLAVAFAPESASASGQRPGTGVAAAATESGSGAFGGLHVTVDQTTNLIHQVVKVTWTGGTPTPVGVWSDSYLQVMQCWGDSTSGPSVDQCQYGGDYSLTNGGTWVTTRQLSYGAGLCDPIERVKYLASSHVDICQDGLSNTYFAPFTAVNGTVTSDGNTNQFFDQNTTNEQPFNRTFGDGTGISYFEMQTSREAPGLGCGATVTNTITSATGTHGCWLVVVPRSTSELLGDTGGYSGIYSSPLSATNWANRIVFPLSFQPIGNVCPIAAAERHTFGQEQIGLAISSWQPVLCQGGGAVYGYSQVSDDLARGQIAGGAEALAFTSHPIPTAQVAAGHKPLYAPVAISALGIGFLVERISPPWYYAFQRATDGVRVPQIKLNARLVAKLLTQSYRTGGLLGDPKLSRSAYDLTRDPEFLALNPDFNGLYYTAIGDALVPYIPADSTRELWRWVASDSAARAFIAGTKDPWGSGVNPMYRAMSLDRPDFPKIDPFCITNGTSLPQCTLQAHAYGNGLGAIAAAVSKGDPSSFTSLNQNTNPASWSKTTLQAPGYRNLLGITDTPSAIRYGITMASLLTSSGEYVAPTTESMLSEVAAWKTDAVTGTLIPNPGAKVAGGYPLTTITYAVTDPVADSAPARSDYSAFLQYAAGAGQVSGLLQGQLPPGYAPLPQAMRNSTIGVAAELLSMPVVAPSPSPTATKFTPTPTSSSPVFTSPTPSVSSIPSVTTPLPATSAPVATPAMSSVAFTPSAPVGASRWTLALALALGGTGLLVGPVLLRLASGAQA